jgi:serine/threonine protein kinase
MGHVFEEMGSVDSTELLAVIVAQLEEEGAHAMLEAVAFAGGEICVPLLSAPVDASRHVLEVYAADELDPLLLFAVPLGPPTEHGFLLRLAPYEPTVRVGPLLTGAPTPAAPLRSRFPTASDLTAGHAAALAAPTSGRRPSHVGRVIAAGKLELERLIGAGGMGLVYRAMHKGLSMPVAVKVLHEHLQRDLDFCRLFHEEALAASRLDHPNLTRVLDFGQEPDGLVYIAMELLAGSNLRSVLQAQGTMGSSLIADIMMQITLGLTHVHARGMVHRDMKPDNVVLVASEDEEGRPIQVVKLCDFGIAVARGAPGAIVGTPEYMSPEQCEGASLDARSDVYACGVMLYEMATGRTPFEGQPPTLVIAHHLRVEPAPPAGVDPRLAAIIMKALRKAPEARFQSARELRHALRELLAPPSLPEAAKGESGSAPPDWLEDRRHGSGIQEAPGAHRSGLYASVPISTRSGATLSNSLASDPARWLSELGATSDPRSFSALCEQLEEAVPVLAIRSDMATLWRVRSTLALLAEEGEPLAGSRAASAQRLLKQLQGAAVLSPAAADVLHAEHPTREARCLIMAAGIAGAYALYGTRATSPATDEGRARFTAAMLEIGAMAWPVLRAALERLARETQVGVFELVEDLLGSVPALPDDTGGSAIALYVRAAKPAVRCATAAALVRAWGPRARPLLVALLQDSDEDVCVATIAALRALNAVGVDVVRRFGVILERDPPVGPALRAEASAALRHATGSGRALAREILERAVRAMPSSNAADDAVLLAACRSLVTLAGKDGARAVVERAACAETALQRRLLDTLEQS